LSYQQKQLQFIADQIKIYTQNPEEKIRATDFGAKISEVYFKGFEDGKEDFSYFFKLYQDEGVSRSQTHSFAGYGWTDDTYKPIYAIKGTSLMRTFYLSQITNTIVSIDATEATSGLNLTFAQSKIKKIRNLIVNEDTTYTNAFQGCSDLEELNITGVIGKDGFDVHYSTKLNKPSITGIINILSTNISAHTITLSKTAVNNAFGIDIDDESTYPQGSEYYELRHSKDNWNINYI
jgi:hypothetical protein